MENNNENLKVLAVGHGGIGNRSMKDLMEMEEQVTTGEDKEMQEMIQKEKENSAYGEGLLMEEGTVKTNPYNGSLNVVADEDVFADDYVLPEEEEAKIKKIINTADEEGKNLTIFELSDALKEAFPFLTDADAKDMVKISQRVRTGEKFSIYNSLPASMKEHIDSQSVGMSMDQKKSMARMFINQLISDTSMLKSMRVAGDLFSEEMDKDIKEFKKESFANYLTQQKNRFDTEWEKSAVKLEEAGDLAGAEKLRKVVAAYTDSYELKGLLTDVETKYGKLYRVKPIKLEKFFRECESFNAKYMRSEFNIKDISLCLPILLRQLNKLPEAEVNEDGVSTEERTGQMYSIIDVKIFLLAFITYTMNMKPERPEEHAFMFYFVSDIMLMDLATGDDDIAFVDTMLTNIKAVIDLLKEKRGNK